MYDMNEINEMRKLYMEDGLSYSAIAEKMNCDWRTVKKYVEMDNFSPERVAPVHRGSKLDPYKPFIDEILEGDSKIRYHKQRHTATRIFERLKEEKGYDGGFTLVSSYVRHWKYDHVGKPAYIPLTHPAGTAQCDFGTAEYVLNGRSVLGRFVVLSFPYSNARFLQLCPGENLECLLEGLNRIFHYIGGVPTEIWFDNASAIVNKVLSDGQRDVNERFERFQAHYGFKATFMNPASGNEKGNVENAVGTLRRELLVPIPEFTSLSEENRLLLEKCTGMLEQNHYKHGVPIKDLFNDDVKNLLVLNPHDFDCARYTVARTDKYGKLVLDAKYTYSASPAVHSMPVQLKITSTEVIIYDNDMHEIVRHERLYGEKAESMSWMPYLKYIARKPRSLFNSGVYEMMPEDMQNFMKSCDNSQRGKILKMLADLTDRSGFESAVSTIQAGMRYNASDPDSLMALYRRMYSKVPVMPRINTSGTPIPTMPHIDNNTDLALLDKAVREGGQMKHD